MKVTKYLIAAVAVLTVCSARADEGMWLLQLMKQQNSIDMMKKQGLKLEADDLYNPNGVSLKDAVGIFGGGCTGEVISAEGLVLTNHHCGYGAIQQHSSVEHDYLTDGFWAMSREEELPCKGLTVTYIDRILDVYRVRKRTTENRRRPERHQLSVSQIPEDSSRPLRQVRRHRPDTWPQTGTESLLRWKQILSVRKDHL